MQYPYCTPRFRREPPEKRAFRNLGTRSAAPDGLISKPGEDSEVLCVEIVGLSPMVGSARREAPL